MLLQKDDEFSIHLNSLDLDKTKYFKTHGNYLWSDWDTCSFCHKVQNSIPANMLIKMAVGWHLIEPSVVCVDRVEFERKFEQVL